MMWIGWSEGSSTPWKVEKMEVTYDPKDPRSIEDYARRLIGHSIKELTSEKGTTVYPTVARSKGGFGTVLERLYFKINPGNNEGVPDFKEAGIELKSCPTIKKGDKLRAKERLVLSVINYEKLATEDWSTSTFWKKNQDLLIVFYFHEDGVSVIDLKVMLAGRWKYPVEDLVIIRQDWEKIKAKVKAGMAHELSEGDTLYLRACTKDSRSRANKVQPFSPIRAKQRALSLKPSYIDSIIERMREQDSERELANKAIKDFEELKRKSFEKIVLERFEPYIGKSTEEIAITLGISYGFNVKHYNDLLTRRILGVKDKVLEFERAEVTIRSIKLEADGRLVESVSFPAFDPIALSKEDDWEGSTVREMFERRFFFVIYQMGADEKKYLKKVMFWTMPQKDLQEVQKIWTETVIRIRQGRFEDLPKMKENPVSHIRPHGRNAQDRVMAPDGTMVKKQCFWLNARYIAEQVGAELYVDRKQSKLPYTEEGS